MEPTADENKVLNNPHFTITRDRNAGNNDYLLSYKGIFVGARSAHSGGYTAVLELGEKFLGDLAIGNVPDHYL